MTVLTREDRIIQRLQKKHGLSEDGARWFLAQASRSLLLDIVDADSAMPVALIEGSDLYEDEFDDQPSDQDAGRARGAAD